MTCKNSWKDTRASSPNQQMASLGGYVMFLQRKKNAVKKSITRGEGGVGRHAIR